MAEPNPVTWNVEAGGGEAMSVYEAIALLVAVVGLTFQVYIYIENRKNNRR